MDNAVSYIDGSSIEDDVLGSAISANDELWEKGKNSIREELVKENEDLIAEYNSLNDDLGTIKNEIKASKSTLEKAKADNEQFEQSLANRKKLAEDVEKAVAEKFKTHVKMLLSFLQPWHSLPPCRRRLKKQWKRRKSLPSTTHCPPEVILMILKCIIPGHTL